MDKTHKVFTLLGSYGGVAKSILAIFNKSITNPKDPLHSILSNATLHLIDLKPIDEQFYENHFPNLYDKIIPHQIDLKDTERFISHLTKTETDLVIDVSWADTVEMLQCCDQLGIMYVNTALENTNIDENEELYRGFPLIERIYHLEDHKDDFTQTTAIIGSGMNPGIVQWMALELLKDSEEKPLACYIVEHDDTFYIDEKNIQEKTLYTTWSPECFLDEAIESYPMFMQHHTPLYLYETPYNVEFKVTLGDKQFYGCLMPHEEVFTLGKLFDVETGFLYKINDHTTNVIRENLDDLDVLWTYNMVVLNPNDAELDGADLVGVLLVYKNQERYMYNVTRSQDIFAEYGTNATYFQVACGIYASVCVLLFDTIPPKAYYLDELLLNTPTQFKNYLTTHMKEFVQGSNQQSDGLLLQRMRYYQE